MALSDPISATFQGGSNVNFPRISSDGRVSKYFHDYGGGEDYTITVSHTEGKRKRSLFRVDRNVIIPSLYDSSNSNRVSSSFYLVSDRPAAGIEDSEVIAVYTGLTTLLEASTNAKLTAWVGGES